MRTHSSHNERGIALFVTLFAILLLSAIAFGLMYMADTETSINYNYRSAQQAFFAAQAGLQEVRERMMPANTGTHLIVGPTTVPATANAGSVIYVVNPTTVAPTSTSSAYFDNELCHENFTGLGLTNPGLNIPCASAPSGTGWAVPINSDAPFALGPNAMSYKWVRITQKVNITAWPYVVDGSNPSAPTNPNTQICWDGIHEFLLPSGIATCTTPDAGSTYPPARSSVFVLTSLAVTDSGARRMAQMEVAQDPPMITNAAVDSQDHVVLNGQLTVSGYDYCSCSCTTTKQGNNYVTTCTDRSGKVCDRSKYAIFSASSVDNPGQSEQVVAGTPQPIAQNQVWPYDIQGEIDRYRYQAGTVDATLPPYGYSCTGSPPACGTHAGQTFGTPPAFPPNPPDNPASDPSLGTWTNQVTYVPGNLQITGGSIGSGILIVDGDLDIHGGLQFYGLILVRGVISFTGGGSDKTNIFGSVLAGQESRVDTVLGGSAVISFDYCALPQGNRNRPPSVIAFRELTY